MEDVKTCYEKRPTLLDGDNWEKARKIEELVHSMNLNIKEVRWVFVSGDQELSLYLIKENAHWLDIGFEIGEEICIGSNDPYPLGVHSFILIETLNDIEEFISAWYEQRPLKEANTILKELLFKT